MVGFFKALTARIPVRQALKMGARRITTAVITDVEGDAGYLKNAVRKSPVLTSRNGRLGFHPDVQNPHFVYGGDPIDQAPGDFSVLQALTTFKAEQPDDVTLILGNRELKCLRLLRELNPEQIRERLLFGYAGFWNPEATPQKFLQDHMLEQGYCDTSFIDMKRYLDKLSNIQCQTIYLKWMLQDTMGCFHTYEYRRQELARLKGKKVEDVSDDEVTESFISSVAEGGLVRKYLERSQLVRVCGKTLYVHGAITEANMGYVPGRDESAPRVDDAREWMEMLNYWGRRQVQHALNNPYEGIIQAPGSWPLDKYALFNRLSVITTNWNHEGFPVPVSSRVAEYLMKSGVEQVITGHIPTGDVVDVRCQHGLTVINADLSYSDPQRAAHHAVTVDDENGKAYVDGVDSKGQAYSVDTSKASLTGQFTQDGGLVGPMTDGKYVVRHRRLPHGFDARYLSEEETQQAIDGTSNRVSMAPV